MTAGRAVLISTLIPLVASCGGSTSGSWSKRAPQPDLAIEGHYELLDASELQTGCIVHIFVQDERYRGWVLDDPEQNRECDLLGYEFTNFQTRGFDMRVSVRCPRSGYCPGDITGSARFVMMAVPVVAITGRVYSGSQLWRTGRWREVTLVYLRKQESGEF